MPDVRPGGPELRGRGAERHLLQRALPPVGASVRLARITARTACRAWRVPDAGDPAALMASELVTAALSVRRRGTLTLRVLMTPRRLRIELHDPSGSVAVPGAEGWSDDWGASVLAAVSARWGVEPQGSGAQLYAELALPVPRAVAGITSGG